MMNSSTQAIGVFDSGLGGLTVLKYLLKFFPDENFIYLGDLAHLPYGNKSKNNIINYSLKCAKFLESKNVKAIVIACNTASACAYKAIKEQVAVPVFDVITPCIKKISLSDNKEIVILGTEQSIQSGTYSKLIKKINNKIIIHNKACPLFVPIVEEGLEGSSIAKQIIDYYLKDIKVQEVETLILGCTHYPILIDDLNLYFNNQIKILHSGPIIAEALSKSLPENQFNNKGNQQSISYYVTDFPDRFQKFGSKFLGDIIEKVELIQIN